jgi:hypothetical protein
MTPLSVPAAFTVRYQGRSLRLTSEIEIFPAFDLATTPQNGRKYQALYDTGASHSAVSPRVVSELQLTSIAARNVNVGGGVIVATSHLVNFALPNKVMFGMMQVSQMVLGPGIDALIGMDVLGLGDFAVTHHNGNTTFSFCCPSRKEIDFAIELRDDHRRNSPKVGRNDPCPCGSGKKYKKCHGA